MYPSSGAPYALSGVNAMLTDAISNRVFATFVGTDPFTARYQRHSVTLINFGSASGSNLARSTFIDDGNFAAAEKPGDSLPG